MKFGCIIENNRLKINRANDFAEYCKSLIGKDLILELRERSKKRSEQQNSYYWGVVVKTLSDELGYETDEIHELLKQMFINPIFKEIKGIEFEIRKSTTKLSTKEFKEYIEKIQRWASQEEIYIPDPLEFII